MLVLSRTLGSSVYIGDGIEVILIHWTEKACRLALLARGQEAVIKWVQWNDIVPIVNDIAVRVVEIRPTVVRLGFIAPEEVKIVRDDANDPVLAEQVAA